VRVANIDLLETSGTVDLSASAELEPVWLGHIVHYSVQLVFSGTPAGTFKLQASNDVGSVNSASSVNQDSGIVNWTDLSGQSAVISASGNYLFVAENSGYCWVRLVWVASGAGTTPELTSARAYVKGM
jgi:hypothetical protein